VQGQIEVSLETDYRDRSAKKILADQAYYKHCLSEYGAALVWRRHTFITLVLHQGKKLVGSKKSLRKKQTTWHRY